MQPAIRYAEDGSVVHDRVAQEWASAGQRLWKDPEARSVFLVNDAPPKAGAVVKNPALARSLAIVAEQGRAGFYEGALAERMVAHLRASGGFIR
jgi:gamma-glutamyltranspeptidase/glutathione hydrolase